MDACDFYGVSLRAAPRIYWPLQSATRKKSQHCTPCFWMSGSAILTGADFVMDGGVIASGVSGLFLLILFTSSKFQKAFHVNIPTISPTITALLQ